MKSQGSFSGARSAPIVCKSDYVGAGTVHVGFMSRFMRAEAGQGGGRGFCIRLVAYLMKGQRVRCALLTSAA